MSLFMAFTGMYIMFTSIWVITGNSCNYYDWLLHYFYTVQSYNIICYYMLPNFPSKIGFVITPLYLHLLLAFYIVFKVSK